MIELRLNTMNAMKFNANAMPHMRFNAVTELINGMLPKYPSTDQSQNILPEEDSLEKYNFGGKAISGDISFKVFSL